MRGALSRPHVKCHVFKEVANASHVPILVSSFTLTEPSDKHFTVAPSHCFTFLFFFLVFIL